MAKVAPADSVPDPLLRHLLSETDESATAALFVQLCQHSPELCHWLWEDFARDAKVRERFKERLRQKESRSISRISDLSEVADAWQQEVASLRARFSNRIYGGLTWREVETLIGRLRAGRADLTAFLLALQWRRAGTRAKNSPHLLRASASFLGDALATGSRTRLSHLATALRTVHMAKRSAHRASVGFSDWWKLQLLLYVLRNPRDSYRTRDLHAHLGALGLAVNTKEIRRFCSRYGIRRDMRAGRPRGKASASIPTKGKSRGRPAGRATASELHRP